MHGSVPVTCPPHLEEAVKVLVFHLPPHARKVGARRGPHRHLPALRLHTFLIKVASFVNYADCQGTVLIGAFTRAWPKSGPDAGCRVIWRNSYWPEWPHAEPRFYETGQLHAAPHCLLQSNLPLLAL